MYRLIRAIVLAIVLLPVSAALADEVQVYPPETLGTLNNPAPLGTTLIAGPVKVTINEFKTEGMTTVVQGTVENTRPRGAIRISAYDTGLYERMNNAYPFIQEGDDLTITSCADADIAGFDAVEFADSLPVLSGSTEDLYWVCVDPLQTDTHPDLRFFIELQGYGPLVWSLQQAPV